jgi:hypothetical protein
MHNWKEKYSCSTKHRQDGEFEARVSREYQSTAPQRIFVLGAQILRLKSQVRRLAELAKSSSVLISPPTTRRNMQQPREWCFVDPRAGCGCQLRTPTQNSTDAFLNSTSTLLRVVALHPRAWKASSSLRLLLYDLCHAHFLPTRLHRFHVSLFHCHYGRLLCRLGGLGNVGR